MTAAKQLLDDKFLKNFAPLGDLDTERFNKIAKSCTVEQYDAGTRLFQIGDRDNRTIYLMSGQVSLTFRSGTERIITAETNQARNALVPEQPRQATAVAKTPITLLIIDSDILDQVLHWNDNGYEISELEVDEDNDWMTMFLQSKAFLKLRAQNIQALMMRLEEIPVKAGHVIVKQGDDDGYYYIVKRGKCRVTRKPTPSSAEIEVAVLGVGAGFGEEALIMHDSRGATVTMIENGQLMRLTRSDFTRLLAEPLVQVFAYKDLVRNPKSVFLDVRAYEEYVRDGIRNSENCPLAELRGKIGNFDSHKQYVMVSNDGGRASAAAFLLCQQGLDAVVLERGLFGLPEDTPRGNGAVEDLENIPTVDNVVDFNKLSQQADGIEQVEDQEADTFDVYDEYDQLEALEVQVPEEEQEQAPSVVAEPGVMEDPRVNAIFTRAKQRVSQEANKARAAEQARKKAEQELARLKEEAEQARVEVEKARKQAESAAHQSAEVARLEAIKEAARLREVELSCKQAEVEEAIKQAEEEAQRAYTAEIAYREAQEENARLKREMQEALERTQEEARKSTEALKIFAEQEAKHYREVAKKRAREEAKRIKEAEKARKNAEAEIEKLKDEAEATRQQLEEQAKILADEARSEAEQSAAQQRAEELAKEQAEKEAAIHQAMIAVERATKAEEARRDAEVEIEKMREEADRARAEAAEQARIAADQARSDAEQEAASQKAQVLAEKQLEIEEAVRRAEAEAARARAAEEARRLAEQEIERVRQAAASERARIEEEALRIADAARQEAEHKAEEKRAMELAAKQSEIDLAEQKAMQEAERAYTAEQARLQAEAEIERLKVEAENTRIELEKQLSADIKRSEVEHQVARVRAEELVNKQSEIDEIAQAAEQASLRAMAAEEARLNAEQEIERLKSEIEQGRNADSDHQLRLDEAELKRKHQEILKIGRTLEAEAKRVQAAEAAQIQAQEEISRLRAEVESLNRQAQQQLSEDVQRAAEKNASVREQAQELSQKQQQIEAAIAQAQQEAQRAQEAIEARIQAEEQVKHLKTQTDLAFHEAKEMVRRSQVEARKQFEREIEQARAEEAALRQAEVKDAARKANQEAKRAEAAEKARLAAEREIERLKVAAEVQRIKAEKAIKDSIKAASQAADNKVVKTKAKRAPQKSNINQTVEGMQDPAVDYFANEPQTDLEAQDDMSLLFTNIDVGEQPKGATDRILAMTNEPEKKEDDELEEVEAPQTSAWVSDQVMWEATLGIREDEKAQTIIAPKQENGLAQFFGRGNDAEQIEKPEEKRADGDKRSIFRGRELNPHLKQPVALPAVRRRQITAWLKKAKILLWLSPLIVAIGYYFSLSEHDQIDLQLKIARTTQSLFGSSNKDISKDAAKLIKETEARLNQDGGKSQKAGKVDGAKTANKKHSTTPAKTKTSKSQSRPATAVKKQPVQVKAKTFAGKDIPFDDNASKVTSIPAPQPVPAIGSTEVSGSQPVLPPLPDATSTIEPAPVTTNVSERKTVTSGTVINNVSQSKVTTSGRTSIGELPPVAAPARNDTAVDVNADQNTATFHK